MRVTLKEGSAAERSYRFHAPDPSWVPTATIERARKRLCAFNPRLSIWWSPTRRAAWDEHTPGRWRVVEWMPDLGNWTTNFYWEGPEGQYRAPEPVEPILERLAACMVPLDVLDAQLGEESEKASRERRKELTDACREHAEDLRERSIGVRQVYAPGYIRRRQVKRSDLVNTNHQRFVREHRESWSGAVRGG